MKTGKTWVLQLQGESIHIHIKLVSYIHDLSEKNAAPNRQGLSTSAFLKKVFRSILGRYNRFRCVESWKRIYPCWYNFLLQKGEACYWNNSPGRSFPVGSCLGVEYTCEIRSYFPGRSFLLALVSFISVKLHSDKSHALLHRCSPIK